MKLPMKPRPGTTVTVEKAVGKNVVSSESTQHDFMPTPAGPWGVSGMAHGVTIPGPQGSYRMARIDVACYLPHGPSPELAREAIKAAGEIVQEYLEKEAEAVADFLDGGS